MVVAVLLTLSACSKKEEAPVITSPLTDTSGPLRYVPADTPYIMSGLEPAPDDFMDKMEPMVDRLLASYRTMLQAAMADALRENPEESPDPEFVAKTEALVEELLTLLSLDGLRGAGMTRESTFIFYGHGLLPVLRVSLTDDALLDDALSRIETGAGESLPVGEIQGKQYRYFDADKVRVILATFDDQLILTVMPASFDESELAQLLGLALPAENIAQTGVLQGIADDYGFMAAFVGFFSIERLAATFIDEPVGLNKSLLTLAGYDANDLGDVYLGGSSEIVAGRRAAPGHRRRPCDYSCSGTGARQVPQCAAFDRHEHEPDVCKRVSGVASRRPRGGSLRVRQTLRNAAGGGRWPPGAEPTVATGCV
jgi:hypothetical protein